MIFNSGAKAAFRRWAANRIAAGVAALRSRGPVVYLLGPEPRDWRTLTDAGIPRDALLGISHDPIHVAAARAVGLWALEASLADFLLAWRAPLGGLLYDSDTIVYCEVTDDSDAYGLCGEFAVVSDAIAFAAAYGRFPVVANVLRGRDGDTAQYLTEGQTQLHDFIAARPGRMLLRKQLWSDRSRSLVIRAAFATTVYGDPTEAEIERDLLLDCACGRLTQLNFSYRSIEKNQTLDARAFVAVPHKWRCPARPLPDPAIVRRIAAYRALRTRTQVA